MFGKFSTTRDGELRLSVVKVIVMALIVGFFSIVANLWEGKQRRRFFKSVKFKDYSSQQLKKVLDDFDVLTSCSDPYIENFNKKNPDFDGLHHLWTLNSHEYWTELFKNELLKRGEEYVNIQ